MKKICPLEELANLGGVLVHGSYDGVHPGHLRFWKWAKSQLPGSILTVTLTSDAHFPKYKGPLRPAFPEDVRAEWISYIEIVDFVAIVHEPTGVAAIDIIKPTIYAKGHEAEGLIPHEVDATERNGGCVLFMPRESIGGQIYSSGRILSGEYLRSRAQQPRPRGIGEGDYGVE
jgi:cytidyltransferase-like protein